MDPQAVDKIVQKFLPVEAACNPHTPALRLITAGLKEVQLLGVVNRLATIELTSGTQLKSSERLGKKEREAYRSMSAGAAFI